MYIYTYTHAKKNIDGIIYLGMSEIYNIMSENNIQAYTILYIVYLGHVWKKSLRILRVSGPVAGSMTSPSDLSVGLGHHKWG